MMPKRTQETMRPSALAAEVSDFLCEEAAALDEHRVDDWLNLLTEDFEYVVPLVEIYEDPHRSPYHEHGFLDRESKGSLRLKLTRRESEYAWAQRPPGFLRHFITNVRVVDHEETAAGDELDVRSNVLVSFTRDPEPPQLFSAGRLDHLRRTPDGLRLAHRTVHIDSATPRAAQVWVVY